MVATNTLPTWLASSAIASTKKTRCPRFASRKLPGETWDNSQRAESFCLYSAVLKFAHGDRKPESTAMAMTIGSAKRKTGRIQAVNGWPQENQTTISES